MAFTYIIECSDGSYYVGSTQDLDKRIKQHQSGHGCLYTTLHRPVKLVYKEENETYQQTFARERQIRGWSRAKNRALIEGDVDKLRKLSKYGLAGSPSPSLKQKPMRFLSLSKEKNQYGQYLLKVIDELKETGKPNLE